MKKSNGNHSAKKSAKTKNTSSDKDMLREFLLDELKDIYWAEKHLVKALPKMEKAATTPELKDAFADHLAVTENHVSRLEEIFEMMGEKAVAKKCEAMSGLTAEAEEIISETESGTLTRDVGLIVAAQKVEHYEIATYGSLAQLAATLGESDVESLLRETLDEEKEADVTLTQIAEDHVNEEALAEAEEEVEAEEEE
jgi:ferritin-like metal-binding protein YciE